MRERIVADLVDLGCQREHIPPADVHHRGGNLRRCIYAVVLKVTDAPAAQLGGRTSLKLNERQKLTKAAEQLGRSLGKKALVDRPRCNGNEQRIIIVLRQLGEHLAKALQHGRLHGGKIQSAKQNDLALGHHGKRHQRAAQRLGGNVQRVQDDLIEAGKARISPQFPHGLFDGVILQIILFTEQQVAQSRRAFDLLAEIRILENDRLCHSSPPLHRSFQ